MAIEPISSVMTVQAQGSATPRTQTIPEEKTELSASSSTKEAAKVDANARVVENAQDKAMANNDQNREAATNDQIKKAVEQFNKNVANSEAIFGFHEGTNRVTIKIVDKDTKKVIKELPPEKTLDMIARVWDMAGILVDERR